MADIWLTVEQAESEAMVLLAKDSSGISVYCSGTVWRDHILIRHPEVALLKDLILSAIESPDMQETDPEDARVTRYYVAVPRDRIESPHRFWLRVVIKYLHPVERRRERTGVLSSVYLVRRKE